MLLKNGNFMDKEIRDDKLVQQHKASVQCLAHSQLFCACYLFILTWKTTQIHDVGKDVEFRDMIEKVNFG